MLPLIELDAALRLGLKSGFGGPLVRLGHVKMFADGALGSTTAEMLAPYDDLPGECGVAATSTEALYHAARAAAQGGLSSAIHAIGDAAVRRVLDVYARLRAEGLRTRLPQRIEHVQLLDPADLPRLAALGVVASMQPIHAPQDRLMAERHWGARARYGYAWRSVLHSGAALILGTDCPVETLNPLANLYAAVTRRTPQGEPTGGWYPQEALTLDEALRAYTLAPALATGEAHLKGSLTPGKLADLVVLSRDVHAGCPEDLLISHVDLTLLGGRIIYGCLSK
jgi:predicted amidohydrolase YtcJ